MRSLRSHLDFSEMHPPAVRKAGFPHSVGTLLEVILAADEDLAATKLGPLKR